MAKKSFKINPAMNFITPTAELNEPAFEKQIASENVGISMQTPPEGYRLNPKYIETKSKRLQILMKPSLHEKIKAAAASNGKSVNEYIHAALERAVGTDAR